MTRPRTTRLVAFAAALSLAGAAVAQDASAPFSDAERRRLVAGELVRRNVSRTEGRYDLFGGTSWMRVRAPVEQVWAVVSDPAAYPRLIPSLERVRVVEDRGDTRVLHMHHSYSIASTDYHMRMRMDPARRVIRFELDRSRPHDVRAGRGFLELRSFRGDTIVTWGMLADVGAGVIQQVFGPFLDEWLLKPPRCLRDEVEPGRRNTC